jgi:pyruvate/2-oxoglutarate dehydrogenase complex dihydrolipoamide acyltransferase (E2) component
MKTEIEVLSPTDGTVAQILCQPGQVVIAGQMLLLLIPASVKVPSAPPAWRPRLVSFHLIVAPGVAPKRQFLPPRHLSFPQMFEQREGSRTAHPAGAVEAKARSNPSAGSPHALARGNPLISSTRASLPAVYRSLPTDWPPGLGINPSH